jgi:hypothetical protein
VYPFGNHFCTFHIADIFEEHHKFISSEPGDRITLPDAFL